MSAEDFAEGWYAPLGGALSQGDIVRLVPAGLIDSPLTICQPNNADPMGKAKYAPYDQVSTQRSLQFIHAKGAVGFGMVVWPDCQIDKGKNQQKPEREWVVGIAPVKPLKDLKPELAQKIFDFERAQWFPLAAHEPDWDDSYVDLRYIWTVRYGLLADRVTAITENTKRALQLHLFWFQTEARLPESVACPHCANEIEGSLLLRFKQDPAEDQDG